RPVRDLRQLLGLADRREVRPGLSLDVAAQRRRSADAGEGRGAAALTVVRPSTVRERTGRPREEVGVERWRWGGGGGGDRPRRRTRLARALANRPDDAAPHSACAGRGVGTRRSEERRVGEGWRVG